MVTLPDEQTVPRLTQGMYAHMGMDALVAKSVDEYAQLAVRVREDAAWRGQLAREICGSNGVLYQSESAVEEWARFLRSV